MFCHKYLHFNRFLFFILNKYQNYLTNPIIVSKKDVFIAFICHLKQRPGKMNVQECLRLNIPFGPLFGQLQRGQEITLPDGRVVKYIDWSCKLWIDSQKFAYF